MIDQFMLGNRQFVDSISAPEADLGACVRKYGGQLVELPEGSYEVMRDPIAKIMVVAPPQSISGEALQQYVDGSINDFESHGMVFVDTRCLVVIDADALRNQELLDEYSSLRKAGDMKGGRDYLRSQGAAVRYGFNQSGDELGVFKHSSSEVVGLWPDLPEEEIVEDDDENFGNR